MAGPKCAQCGGGNFAVGYLPRPEATDVVFVHCSDCGQIAGVTIEPPGRNPESPVHAVVHSSPARPIHVTGATTEKPRDLFI
jgi:hypothetical protein